jgi:hypothetical protein
VAPGQKKLHLLIGALAAFLLAESIVLFYFTAFGQKVCDSAGCMLDALKNNCQSAVQTIELRSQPEGSKAVFERRIASNGTVCIYNESGWSGGPAAYSVSLVLPLKECIYSSPISGKKSAGYVDFEGNCNTKALARLAG